MVFLGRWAVSYERGTPVLHPVAATASSYMFLSRGLVGLALKVHLAQARGTLSMGREVYARLE